MVKGKKYRYFYDDGRYIWTCIHEGPHFAAFMRKGWIFTYYKTVSHYDERLMSVING